MVSIKVYGNRFEVSRMTKNCYVINIGGKDLFFGKITMKLENGDLVPIAKNWELLYTNWQKEILKQGKII